MEEFQGTNTSETEWSHDVNDPNGVIVTNNKPWIIPEDDYAGWTMTFNVSKSDNGVKVRGHHQHQIPQLSNVSFNIFADH